MVVVHIIPSPPVFLMAADIIHWGRVKKVQDYYFKKAKKDNYPARSVYKLEETQNKYGILKKGDTVLDLGCQPGSWSLYAARVVGPNGRVVGVDLEKGRDLYRTGAARILTFSADIMEEDIVTRITELAPSFNVVLSDIAPRTTGSKWADQQQSINLSRRTLEIALSLLAPGGNYYCKVFEGEDFKEYFDEVRGHFIKVKTVKPKSSRKESREVFVLGMDRIPE